MKRAPELVPLSHQHHHGLVASKRVLFTLEKSQLAEEIRVLANEVVRFHEIDLEPHFSAEEQWLLPHATSSLRERTQHDHGNLRSLIVFPDHVDAIKSQLITWADVLTTHIRFEERELFHALQETLSPQQLHTIGRELSVLETENPTLPGKPIDRSQDKR